MGIVFLDHKLAWGYKYGFGGTWLPQWFLKGIVITWNFIACRVYEHDWLPFADDDDWENWTEEICSACCKHRAKPE